MRAGKDYGASPVYQSNGMEHSVYRSNGVVHGVRQSPVYRLSCFPLDRLRVSTKKTSGLANGKKEGLGFRVLGF